MFGAQNRIIIVDDNSQHLFDLANRFSKEGLASRLIHYDQSKMEQLDGIRLAFFDINLTPQTINLRQQSYDYKTDASLSTTFNYLSTAIEDIISPTNGPYILVFWSDNTVLIDNFIEYVKDRKLRLPRPLSIECIDKSDSASIDSRIKAVLSHKAISLLYNFERKCELAASKTINEIYDIIPKDLSLGWGDTDNIFETEFKNIFSKIAYSTLGKNAESNLDKAIIESFLPVLNFHINSLVSTEWDDYIPKPLALKAEVSNTTMSRLNSFFHIDTCPHPLSRGSVYQLNNGKNNKALGKKITNKRKRKKQNKKDILKSQYDYGKYIDEFDEWVEKCLALKKEGDLKRNVKEKQLKEIETIIKESELIAIEISAACDFSQNNPRNLKYILGIKSPLVDKDLVHNSKPGNVFNHQPKVTFFLNGEYFQIVLDMNRVITTSRSEELVGAKLLFGLKKEFVDMIGHNYASHISRIGITSF